MPVMAEVLTANVFARAHVSRNTRCRGPVAAYILRYLTGAFVNF